MAEKSQISSGSQWMANKRIIKNYPSQATGILQDENMKWLAISSLIPINSIMKENSLILKFVIKKRNISHNNNF